MFRSIYARLQHTRAVQKMLCHQRSDGSSTTSAQSKDLQGGGARDKRRQVTSGEHHPFILRELADLGFY
jgi:hypothetical protein